MSDGTLDNLVDAETLAKGFQKDVVGGTVAREGAGRSSPSGSGMRGETSRGIQEEETAVSLQQTHHMQQQQQAIQDTGKAPNVSPAATSATNRAPENVTKMAADLQDAEQQRQQQEQLQQQQQREEEQRLEREQHKQRLQLEQRREQQQEQQRLQMRPERRQ